MPMFSKLSIVFMLYAALPLHCSSNLQKAESRYRNTPEYVQWQELKEKVDQEKTLEKLNQEFFDMHRICNAKKSGFRSKLVSECEQVKEIGNTIVELKKTLHDLEENAIKTKDGQDYFKLARSTQLPNS